MLCDLSLLRLRPVGSSGQLRYSYVLTASADWLASIAAYSSSPPQSYLLRLLFVARSMLTQLGQVTERLSQGRSDGSLECRVAHLAPPPRKLAETARCRSLDCVTG